MGATAKAAVAASKVLARLGRWQATAWLLGHCPLAFLDEHSIGRLRYALMQAHREHARWAQDLLGSILRKNAHASAEMKIELAAMATATGQPQQAVTLLAEAEHESADPYTADAARRLR